MSSVRQNVYTQIVHNHVQLTKSEKQPIRIARDAFVLC